MGDLTIRFPESLHRRLRALAAREGVPVGQFVVQAATEQAVRHEAEADEIASLLKRARRYEETLAKQGLTPRERMTQLMDKGPGAEPREGDAPPEEA